MKLTPNLITLFRIGVAFAAVCLYGRNPWANHYTAGALANWTGESRRKA